MLDKRPAGDETPGATGAGRERRRERELRPVSLPESAGRMDAEGLGPEELTELFDWAEERGIAAQAWYLHAKRPVQRWSKAIRVALILAATTAAVIPALALIFHPRISPEWAFVALAIAAGILLFDVAFGVSSTWSRYMVTAADLGKKLTAFQLEWVELSAKSPADVDESLKVLTKFMTDVTSTVDQETKTWAAEFSRGMEHVVSGLGSH